MAKKKAAKKKARRKPAKPRPRQAFGFHIPAKIKEFKIDRLIVPEDWDTEDRKRKDSK